MRKWKLIIFWKNGHRTEYVGKQQLVLAIADTCSIAANKMKLRTEN